MSSLLPYFAHLYKTSIGKWLVEGIVSLENNNVFASSGKNLKNNKHTLKNYQDSLDVKLTLSNTQKHVLSQNKP